jgi:hypothetical protein
MNITVLISKEIAVIAVMDMAGKDMNTGKEKDMNIMTGKGNMAGNGNT